MSLHKLVFSLVGLDMFLVSSFERRSHVQLARLLTRYHVVGSFRLGDVLFVGYGLPNWATSIFVVAVHVAERIVT
jgi:hypothetical protein